MSSFYGKSYAGWASWENWQPSQSSSWNGNHTSWHSKASHEREAEYWMGPSNGASNGDKQSWYGPKKSKGPTLETTQNGTAGTGPNGSASQGRLTREPRESQEPERPRAASAPARALRGGFLRGAAALLTDPEKAPERRVPDRPQPSLEQVQQATDAINHIQCALLAEKEDNSKMPKDIKDKAKLKKKMAQAYQRAVRLCALCPGKELSALKWLEDFEDFGMTSCAEEKTDQSVTYRQQDHPEWRPDVPDYLAALYACEVSHQPLERVWTLLMDLRKQGLDLDSSRDRDQKEIETLHQQLGLLEKRRDKSESVEEEILELHQQLEHAHEAVAYVAFFASRDAMDALQHHTERWLTEAPHPRAIAAVLRLGSLLSRSTAVSNLHAVRQHAVTPILEAFREENHQRLVLVKDLGIFTTEALRSLGIHTVSDNGTESAWRREAAKAVHRQAMLQKWSSWNAAEGSGSFAWLAYDLSSQIEQFRCDGEVVGRAPKSPMVSEELFPLGQDQRQHAEQRALMLLTEKLLQGFSESQCDCIEVRGVLMLYTPFPPETASIFAMLQFLQRFPWVELYVSFEDALDLASPGTVERIRCERKEPQKDQKAEALNGNGINGTKS